MKNTIYRMMKWVFSLSEEVIKVLAVEFSDHSKKMAVLVCNSAADFRGTEKVERT